MIKIVCMTMAWSLLAFAASIGLCGLLMRINSRQFRLWTLPVFILSLWIVPACAVAIGEKSWGETVTLIVFAGCALAMMAGEVVGLLRFRLKDDDGDNNPTDDDSS